MKISVLEPLGVSEKLFKAKLSDLIESGNIVEYASKKPETLEEKIEMAKDSDVIVIANTPLEEEVVNACTNLKLLVVGFTGTDHVPMELLESKNIKVVTTAGYCTDEVAELTFGLMINVARNIMPNDVKTRVNQTKDGLQGFTLKGKTLGVIGTGKIGKRVCEIARAFGMNLIGYNRTEHDDVKALGLTYMSLDDVMKNADIVTIHLPLTKETKNLISHKQLNEMKKTAILLNLGRGAVVNNQALADALNCEHIAGAGIDVFETEPPISPKHPLCSAKNCVLTPHIGFWTKDSMITRVEMVNEIIKSNM